jgi:N-acetylmuramoyl-L-alanine amidase
MIKRNILIDIFFKRLKPQILLVLLMVICIFSLNSSVIKKNDIEPVEVNVTERHYDSLNRGQQVQRGDAELNSTILPGIDKSVTILIDAGHGGLDSGTEVSGVEEKTINLDIAMKMGELLKKSGVNILFTRENDEFISLKDRIKLANNSNASLLISIHNNSFENDSEVSGSSTLYYSDSKTGNERMNGKKLAEIAQEELLKALKTIDAGAIDRNNLGILKYVKMPSIIAEVGFLTNSTDRTNLANEEFRKKTAQALSIAVIKAIEQM